MKITTTDDYVTITVTNATMDMEKYLEVTHLLSKYGKFASYAIEKDFCYYYVTYHMTDPDYFNELAKHML